MKSNPCQLRSAFEKICNTEFSEHIRPDCLNKKDATMPVKPSPCTYRCPACGWRKTVSPVSDVLTRGVDSFDRCPRCDNRQLEVRPAKKVGLFQVLLGKYF